MNNWPESPFHEYQCNKRSTYLVIVTKHKKTSCVKENCSHWVNKNCSHQMCKKCCVKEDAVYRTKDHKKPPTTSSGDDVSNVLSSENDVEMDKSNGN